ncbi:hypothetical protein GA0115240_13257 [Streptomyces sp. DvalAA-14]|uniref:hypothetical protein n=1 Tax=unclassified Streptomyces TaxID=2593676 RepID=UPI00081AEB59|nr:MULTISPECIES: hypothetical protein [unclassified Streptomyces]MYS21530.1 hypothetical protein [Streptomyces sp. SID4948]SCD95135.1 hypothetical protein GA0115240_13257 [Streptomyces sp. DvalAA-14]
MPTPSTRRTGAGGVVLGLLALLMSLPAGAATAATPDPQPPKDDPGYVVHDFEVTPVTANYDHHTVTVTGTLAVNDPKAGAYPPAAGQTVDLVEWGTSPTDSPNPDAPDEVEFDRLGTVKTDAQGHFRLADAVIDQRLPQVTDYPDTYTVPVYAMRRLDPAVYGSWGAHAGVPVTCTASKTRFRADYKVGPKIDGAREVTAEGLWERQDGTTWRPYQGGTVEVTYQPAEPGSPLAFHGKTTLGADGHFSLTFTAKADGQATSVAASIPDADNAYIDPPASPRVIEDINVSKAAPTTSPTPSRHGTPTPSVSAPGATPTANQPGALAATGTDSSTLLLGGATLAVAGTALVTAGRRRTRRH